MKVQIKNHHFHFHENDDVIGYNILKIYIKKLNLIETFV